ncbi:YqaJ viral recombinase family protein [Terrimonas rubra]|uniref:YqaJ viral recombinase family protein n=1 Tax=Terrimonas rubra TaxID=1035890 RepID=A0ABW6ABW2_9BACT
MTDPKLKKDKEAGNLSESAKTHLVDVYVSNKYGRNSDIQNKYIQKGLLVEEDSITLYSRVKKNFFKKNEEHLKNDFIMGTPDLYIGKTIQTAERIIDIKSSFDIFTFFRNINSTLNSSYWWQVQGYMALTGAKSATVAYCLVDTPQVIINDEKRKLMWKMGVATDMDPDYMQACEELERLLTYPDIPMNERVIEFDVFRDDEAIERCYERVLKGRNYLSELDSYRLQQKTTNHDTLTKVPIQ